MTTEVPTRPGPQPQPPLRIRILRGEIEGRIAAAKKAEEGAKDELEKLQKECLHPDTPGRAEGFRCPDCGKDFS